MRDRLRWLAGLALALGTATMSRAEDVTWRPVARTPAASPVVASTQPNAVSLGRPVPAATLERPVPLPDTVAATPAVADANVAPAAFTPTPPQFPSGGIVRAQAPPDPPPPTSGGAVAPGGSGPPATFSGPPPVVDQPPFNSGVPVERPLNQGFWDQCREFVLGGPGHKCFVSDHSADTLVSPITNPFLFEDPRSLTEVRPIFIYQTAPNRNTAFGGGNSEFFGLQGRLAFNEQWSLVINKLGFVSLNPNNPDSEFHSSTGFSELWLGPKWTFCHSEHWGGPTIAAAGLTFQIPTGPGKVAQDTGNLMLTPYLSVAHGFGRTSYGTFNAMTSFGYSFGVDNKRSDYFFNSWHVDFDVANWNHIFPLLELNWFHYTANGRARDQNFEGTDLVNFGATDIKGRDVLSLAAGFRYKFNEHAQFGIATEWPLTTARDLTDFRLTVDFILRY
jgi:hypothetical protein